MTKKKKLTIKLPRRVINLLSNKLLWLLLLQLSVLYGLTYWGYHNSKLPYWFDNFVQRTGIWKIYGVKVYGKEPYSENCLIDTRLDIYMGKIAKVKGVLAGINKSENVEKWTFVNGLDERVTINVSYDENTEVYISTNLVNEESEESKNKYVTYQIDKIVSGMKLTVYGIYKNDVLNISVIVIDS